MAFRVINGKRFVHIFVFAVYISVVLCVLSVVYDATLTNNDAIRHYQYAKMSDSSNKSSVETVVLGDSSGGCALNAGLFSELSGQKTLNLCLTGSFGFEGTYNMVKKVEASFPNLKNIIIIQTHNMWYRDFSKEGFFDTLKPFDAEALIALSNMDAEWFHDYLAWLINYDRLVSTVKNYYNDRFMGRQQTFAEIDVKYDYLKQPTERFSNGKRKMDGGGGWKNKIVNPNKLKMYIEIDKMVGAKKINCIFIQGPLHETVYKNSQSQLVYARNIYTHFFT